MPVAGSPPRRSARWALVSGAVVLLAIGTLSATTAAVPGEVTLASTSDSGAKGNDDSYGPSLSADGSLVAFDSYATNLREGDTNTFVDVYVKNLTTGGLTLASSADDGTDANQYSTRARLSADGSAVGFETGATNLGEGDTDAIRDIYVKDLTTGDLILASTRDNGIKANGFSSHASLSADGTVGAFHSQATNLGEGDTNAAEDVYVKDLTTGELTLASTADDGTLANARSFTGRLSADGTMIAFESDASNLGEGDTDATSDIYVKDLTTGELTLASTRRDGVKANSDSYSADLSNDGSTVSFSSFASNLDPRDTNSHPYSSGMDVYVKDLTTGRLTLASTADDGTTANDDALNPDLSANGAVVTFHTTATNLDPSDGDDTVSDVYVKDLPTGDLILASTNASGDKTNSESVLGSLAAGGRVVAIDSMATNLVPTDNDGFRDIYVKQLAPGAPPTSTCEGRAATVYIANGRIVGGPDDGQIYAGTLTGTPGPDVIRSTLGPDRVSGLGGGDLVCALTGDDVAIGAGGEDRLLGGGEQDRLSGGAGGDLLAGQIGGDTLTGGIEADRFDGGRGRDTATDFNPGEGDTKVNIP